ncbi:hypothetical protein [Myxococcus xanthus]|uniref:Uncharacterized protein n=1 Tax=Myxococcus xanthus TaxID=34 RepID=A0A7Y4IIJ4_MYXXA|nr:hypothetical protein [Myxococcus xanthus]NOJ79225.1 hypothetical protein [Myxococcus xanthus]NOJ86558.1 hypothetical protein [Myxococcus xanthus]
MKAYGITREDRGCRPGHGKFPVETYRGRLSRKAHARGTRLAHRRARAQTRVELFNERRDASRVNNEG